ncbi:MAG: glycosyltransferase [Armatimonadota bacterium]
MQNPFVSVILPVYNGEEYISEAIESVINQTYKNFELIIVDDGSNDNTAKIIDKYLCNDNVKYIYKNNGGVSSALNTGIINAVGKWVAFIGMDDIWLPEKLSRQIEVIRRFNDLSIVEIGTIAFDNNGDQQYWSYKTQIQSGKKLLSKILKGNIFCASSIIVKKDELINAGLFSENLTSCEDYYMWFKLLYNDLKVAFIQDYQVRYRLRSNSLSHNIEDLQKHYLCKLKILDIISTYKLSLIQRRNLHKSKRRINYLLNTLLAYKIINNSRKNALKHLIKAWVYTPHRVKLLIYSLLLLIPSASQYVYFKLEKRLS